MEHVHLPKPWNSKPSISITLGSFCCSYCYSVKYAARVLLYDRNCNEHGFLQVLKYQQMNICDLLKKLNHFVFIMTSAEVSLTLLSAGTCLRHSQIVLTVLANLSQL